MIRARLAIVILAGAAAGGLAWRFLAHPHAITTAASPASQTPGSQPGATPVATQLPAARLADAANAPLLAVARAGRRIVAVGDHGVVLLSDDDGIGFRQALQVPTQALLTSVFFIDAQQGWAAGHDGVILATADGGEHWTLQREDVDGDRPLFSIHFRDARHGLAVGLFNTAVFTEDGGKTWTPRALRPDQDEDKHLYGIFAGPGDALFIAAEAGTIYRSLDAGITWDEVQTTDAGSFWAGLALRDGRLLALGQRGHIFESRDLGASWTEVPSGTQESLTAAIERADGSVLIGGLAGTLVERRGGAAGFTATTRPDRLPLTALVSKGNGDVQLFGSAGPVRDAPDASPGNTP